MPVKITQPLRENLNPHIFVQSLIPSLMTSSNLTLGPSALAFNSNLLYIAANNQVNSAFFHSQADREKALEEVSSLLAEQLKPKPKPKAKNLYQIQNNYYYFFIHLCNLITILRPVNMDFHVS